MQPVKERSQGTISEFDSGGVSHCRSKPWQVPIQVWEPITHLLTKQICASKIGNRAQTRSNKRNPSLTNA